MITSTANKQVKNIMQLNKKAKERKEQDVFVVEGIKMFQEAPAERIKQIFVSEAFIKKEENKAILNGHKYEILDNKVFEAVSDTKTPQGIMCILSQFHYRAEDIINKENVGFLVLEDIQDPGNLGTMFRTGEGAGIGGIIMSQNTVDIYNPKTIRSTMGSIYRVPFVYIENLTDILQKIKKKGIKTYAAHLKGKKYYDEFNYNSSFAFLIGNEGNGLSDKIAGMADEYLKIPMEGRVESLNAAIAASILMYEAQRQKRK